MASSSHAVHCPNCNNTWFREEHLVQVDSSVVVREDLPVSARTVAEEYRYVCTECNTVLKH
ncbi:hypothetical protein [Alicyclobacillus dauci]|uniref:Uncharacterized protein n=1 Tax=Alicyclobacillus dauci TaxID=1475485 RepID=A0ABY6Z7V8_9BACL|nr:hypothetical protein [Alicyclobacillus dauci]WAH38912.1 hypothetical protein NZD86_10735 [Alicyclobacillus dauci]